MKKGKTPFAIIAVVVLLLALVPAERAFAAEIGDTDAIAANTSLSVYFSNEEWFVVGNASGGAYSQPDSITLLAVEKDRGTPTFFHATSSDYGGSVLQDKMEEIANGISTVYPNDYAIINPRTLDEVSTDGLGNADDILAGDHYVWPLSRSEWMACNPSIRVYWREYWLRTPYNNEKVFTGSSGGTSSIDEYVNTNFAYRPALNLDLSRVLFTSPAVDGKQGAAGPVLETASTPGNTLKLTVVDAGLSFSSPPTITAIDERTITFSYTADAAAGSAYNTLSALVKNGSTGAIKYYGKLQTSPATSGVSGSATVTVPTGLAMGDTLSVFIEQINGDNLTDYASEPVQIDFAGQTAPTSPTGGINEITGVAAGMEYRATGATGNWTAIAGTSVSGLTAGSYEVRLAGKVDSNTAYLASPAKTITVSDPTPVTPTPTPTDTESVNASSSSPQTGDGTSPGLWIALILMAGAAVISIAVFRRRKTTG